MKATEAEIAWAAGLFEGEGSATLATRGYHPMLSLSMTDRDVVERFAEVVGIGSVTLKKRGKRHWKDQWMWQAGGIAALNHVIGLFLPWVGERRRTQLLAVLDGYEAAPIRRRSR